MRLITIATFEHPFQVDLALALLADAGIPARQAGAYMQGVPAFHSGRGNHLRIEVPEDRAEEAERILAEADLPQ